MNSLDINNRVRQSPENQVSKISKCHGKSMRIQLGKLPIGAGVSSSDQSGKFPNLQTPVKYVGDQMPQISLTDSDSSVTTRLNELNLIISLDHNYALSHPPSSSPGTPEHSKPKQRNSGGSQYLLHGAPEPKSYSNSKPNSSNCTNANCNSKTMSPRMSATSKLEHLLKKGLKGSIGGRNGNNYVGNLGTSVSRTTTPVEQSLPLSSPRNKTSTPCTVVPSSVPVHPPISRCEESFEEIDVLTPAPNPQLRYDPTKAFNLMNECEKNVNFARTTDVSEDWAKQIVKTGWTKLQRTLFRHVMQALHAENLARLAYDGSSAEPILRRTNLDLTAQRIRQILTGVLWDANLTQWLHGILVDNLSLSYLAAYLDVLQTLRAKAPSLIDRMILLSTAAAAPNSQSDHVNISPSSSPQESETIKKLVNAEALNLLVKRQWDPFSPVVHQHRGKKLIHNPVFVMVPCGPSWANPVGSRRYKSFISMLSVLGKVVSVSVSQMTSTNLTIDEFTEKLIKISEQKLIETKNHFLERPVYLIGWGPGAAIAATISASHDVVGVICLGFPMFGLSGQRGDEGDPLLNVKSPVLFIIGERTPNNSVTHMDKFRRQLKCESTLVVIRTGDDYLRVRRYHRKLLLVTQSFVDKSVIDEVALFITSHLSETPSANGQVASSSSSAVPTSLHPKVLKRCWSTTPSELPPTKIHRPSKSKIEITNDAPTLPEGTEFIFEDTKKISSTPSSSRRKSNYRPISTPSASAAASELTNEKCSPLTNITASKLIQKDPTVRRMSKPSGPNVPNPNHMATVATCSSSVPLMLPSSTSTTPPEVTGVSSLPGANQESLSTEISNTLYRYLSSPPKVPPLTGKSSQSKSVVECGTSPTNYSRILDDLSKGNLTSSPGPSHSTDSVFYNSIDDGIRHYMSHLKKVDPPTGGTKRAAGSRVKAPRRKKDKLICTSPPATPITASSGVGPGQPTTTEILRLFSAKQQQEKQKEHEKIEQNRSTNHSMPPLVMNQYLQPTHLLRLLSPTNSFEASPTNPAFSPVHEKAQLSESITRMQSSLHLPNYQAGESGQSIPVRTITMTAWAPRKDGDIINVNADTPRAESANEKAKLQVKNPTVSIPRLQAVDEIKAGNTPLLPNTVLATDTEKPKSTANSPLKVQTISTSPFRKLSIGADHKSPTTKIIQVFMASELKDYMKSGGDLSQLIVGNYGNMLKPEDAPTTINTNNSDEVKLKAQAPINYDVQKELNNLKPVSNSITNPISISDDVVTKVILKSAEQSLSNKVIVRKKLKQESTPRVTRSMKQQTTKGKCK